MCSLSGRSAFRPYGRIPRTSRSLYCAGHLGPYHSSLFKKGTSAFAAARASMEKSCAGAALKNMKLNTAADTAYIITPFPVLGQVIGSGSIINKKNRFTRPIELDIGRPENRLSTANIMEKTAANITGSLRRFIL